MFNNHLPIMSIENPTLAHFRHFRLLLTNEIRSTNSYVRNYKLFLQNKANFQKSQVNISDLLIREYEQMDTWSNRKNKANANPIQSQNRPNSNPNKPNFRGKIMLMLTNTVTKSPAEETIWNFAGSCLYSQELCLPKF